MQERKRTALHSDLLISRAANSQQGAFHCNSIGALSSLLGFLEFLTLNQNQIDVEPTAQLATAAWVAPARKSKSKRPAGR